VKDVEVLSIEPVYSPSFDAMERDFSVAKLRTHFAGRPALTSVAFRGPAN
jgi:hypothetical protein